MERGTIRGADARHRLVIGSTTSRKEEGHPASEETGPGLTEDFEAKKRKILDSSLGIAEPSAIITSTAPRFGSAERSQTK
jgi:hypothetical protein